MRFGNITPTDIDGLIDFGNAVFVFLEYKRGDNKMPGGQRLALQRLADRKDKPTFVLVGRHENASGYINGAAAILTEYYFNGRWRPARGRMTIKECCDWIERTYRKETQ